MRAVPARLLAITLPVLLAPGCSGKSAEPGPDKAPATSGSPGTATPVAVTRTPDAAPADPGSDSDGDDDDGARLGGALAAPTTKVTMQEYDDLPVDTPEDGDFVHALRFADNSGTNWVVFSQKVVRKKGRSETEDPTESRYLFARHVSVNPDGAYRMVRLVRDKVEDCPFDLTAAFDKKSIKVTDLDGDGIGEITFGYELACASDVSPAIYKLLIIEDGDKYIIRGTTQIMDPSGPFGGEMKIDASLRKGPPAFLAHAKKLWPRLTRRK